MGAMRLLAWVTLVMVDGSKLFLQGRSEMMAWDPETQKGLRKMRWRESLLEPGEGHHGA